MTGLVGVGLSLGHIEHMVRYASVSPFVAGKRVLDIACGSGYGSQFMAVQGAGEVIGVDIDDSAIEYAQTCHGHSRVRYLRADAQGVPELEDASFDVVVAFETIEHVERPRDFLLELRRVLKPAGQCFISCPNDYRPSPWISEFHLNRFRFTEFRDLVLTIFGEAVFLGQHNACASSLLKPAPVPARCLSFGAYMEPLPKEFFGNEHADCITPIENAIGYFAAVGVELSSFGNRMSVSDEAFEVMVSSMQFHMEDAKKAQAKVAAATQEIAALRQRLEMQEATSAERHAGRVQEIKALEEQLRAEQRRREEIEATRTQEVAALRHEVEQERRLGTDQRVSYHRELAALRVQFERAAAEGRAGARHLAALEVEEHRRQLAEEQAAAHRDHIADLERQLDEQRRLAAEQAIARHQDIAALQALLEAEQRGRAQLEADRAREEQRLCADRDAVYQQLTEARREAMNLADELSRFQDFFQRLERTRWWKMRTAWFRLKGWMRGTAAS